MAPTLVSAACAAPASAPANSPMPIIANVRFISVLPWAPRIFVFFECAKHGGALSMVPLFAQRRPTLHGGWAIMTAVFAAGGYRYIPAVFQYSGGVAAERGFAIARIRFHRPVALAEGFRRIEQTIRASGRPLMAFCACELRSPAPFTEDGFRAFNEIYAGTLRKWGVMTGDTNPVARSNVCPEVDPPAEPSFHAFCYTLAADAPPTFVVAGSGEALEGKGN